MAVTRPRRSPSTLVEVTAVETIYLVAALCWIVVVAGGLCVAGYVAVRMRARRRRIDHLLDAIHLAARIRRHGMSFVQRRVRR
ncbi:hypothetical protein E4P42_22190 [Mycobacterium sp. PS03-16]|uniref:hypothetical protein n=1 Tax=Mycobacterium sp. PS03-16 TaxID=2559611 RepID=UPI001073057F|nr:hypothetical protein [Mycobacterium sp. PS03-16]TFV55549.1 hypothetical protein E4P42_22190 [Mycobacterium sp. PS03-16]